MKLKLNSSKLKCNILTPAPSRTRSVPSRTRPGMRAWSAWSTARPRSATRVRTRRSVAPKVWTRAVSRFCRRRRLCYKISHPTVLAWDSRQSYRAKLFQRISVLCIFNCLTLTLREKKKNKETTNKRSRVLGRFSERDKDPSTPTKSKRISEDKLSGGASRQVLSDQKIRPMA